jgi:hypothetical protein
MPKLLIKEPNKKSPLPGRRREFSVVPEAGGIQAPPARPFKPRARPEGQRAPPGLQTAPAIHALVLAPSQEWTPCPMTNERHHVLGKAIAVSVADLERSIDASRLLFSRGKVLPPVPSVDALESLIEILEQDHRAAVNRNYILNLATTLRAGAAASLPCPPRTAGGSRRVGSSRNAGKSIRRVK